MREVLESSDVVEVCRTCFVEGRLTAGGIGVFPPCGHAAEHDTVKIVYAAGSATGHRVVDVTLKADWAPGDPV